MTRYVWLIPILCSLLMGCGSTASKAPPFEGHWRKFDDESGRFVDFKLDRITIGNKKGSSFGGFEFTKVNEEEPLYDVRADMPDGTKQFQLYYEGDTISLIGFYEDSDGLYEIIVELAPIEE